MKITGSVAQTLQKPLNLCAVKLTIRRNMIIIISESDEGRSIRRKLLKPKAGNPLLAAIGETGRTLATRNGYAGTRNQRRFKRQLTLAGIGFQAYIIGKDRTKTIWHTKRGFRDGNY